MDIVIFLRLLPSLICCGSAGGHINNENKVYRPFEGSIRTPMLRKMRSTNNTNDSEKELNPDDPKYKEIIEDVVYQHVGLKKENTKKNTVTKITTQVLGVKINNEFEVNLKNASAAAEPPFISKRYRSDYVYNKSTDAFYKINTYSYRNTENSSTSDAGAVCKEEGAKLMAIESDEDLRLLDGMFKKFPDIGNWLLVAGDGSGHDKVDNHGLCAKVNRQLEIDRAECRGYLSFVCKIPAKDAPYNEECDVYSKYYVSKISLTGSCYRIARIQVNWNEAYANCQAEGAHLAILNNEGEFEVLKQMVDHTPRSVEKYQFFVGIRAEETDPVVYRTIFNQTLDQVGYQRWEEGEPNNRYGIEYCLAVTKRTGEYNDTVCRNHCSYICEKERRTGLKVKGEDTQIHMLSS